MSIFNDILSKLQKDFEEESGKNIETSKIISEIVGTNIPVQNLTIKKGVLYINMPATVKFAINLKKEVLLKKLNDKGIKIGSIQ